MRAMAALSADQLVGPPAAAGADTRGRGGRGAGVARVGGLVVVAGRAAVDGAREGVTGPVVTAFRAGAGRGEPAVVRGRDVDGGAAAVARRRGVVAPGRSRSRSTRAASAAATGPATAGRGRARSWPRAEVQLRATATAVRPRTSLFAATPAPFRRGAPVARR